MPLKKGTSKPKSKAAAIAYSKAGKPKMAKGGSVKPSKGVQGPFMSVKRRDANQLTKIY